MVIQETDLHCSLLHYNSMCLNKWLPKIRRNDPKLPIKYWYAFTKLHVATTPGLQQGHEHSGHSGFQYCCPYSTYVHLYMHIMPYFTYTV